MFTSDNIVYNSFAGTDIVAQVILPNEPPLNLAELQTISYSIHRENTPVRFLGHVNPVGFVRGPRTIAGSMIFTVFNQYAFYRLRQYQVAVNNGLYPLADMLPTFDVVLSFLNEYGALSQMRIYGVTIIDEGQTMSVDDLITEQTYCVDAETEILTQDGWKRHDQVAETDIALTINPQTKVIEWGAIESVHRFPYKGNLVQWRTSRGFDALTTPHHRWLTSSQYQIEKFGFINAKAEFRETLDMPSSAHIVTSGGVPLAFATWPTYTDEFVELIGWAVTEGYYTTYNAVSIAQSEKVNPDCVERIRKLVKYYSDQGATCSEYKSRSLLPECEGKIDFYFGKGIGKIIKKTAPEKRLTPEFICSLTIEQASLLLNTMIDADGHRATIRGENSSISTSYFIQKNKDLVDDFQMLSAMLGSRTASRMRKDGSEVYSTTIYNSHIISSSRLENKLVPYDGIVWCPKTKNMTWLARRNGTTYWTGNTYIAQGIIPITASSNDLVNSNYIPNAIEAQSNTFTIPPPTF